MRREEDWAEGVERDWRERSASRGIEDSRVRCRPCHGSTLLARWIEDDDDDRTHLIPPKQAHPLFPLAKLGPHQAITVARGVEDAREVVDATSELSARYFGRGTSPAICAMLSAERVVLFLLLSEDGDCLCAKDMGSAQASSGD